MTCEKCGGTGFVVIEREGSSAAKRCNCRVAPKEKMTSLTIEDAADAMNVIFDLLDFSPSSDQARAILVSAFFDMVETVEQSKFIINSIPQFYTRWGKCGLGGLRQILCRRYTPKDGIVVNSSDAYPDGLPAARPKEER